MKRDKTNKNKIEMDTFTEIEMVDTNISDSPPSSYVKYDNIKSKSRLT
jgi:hypothetical protein